MNAEIRLVHGAAPGREVARAVANDVRVAGLAVSVIILSGVESVYRWQGKAECVVATVLILKCRAAGVRF